MNQIKKMLLFLPGIKKLIRIKPGELIQDTTMISTG